MRTFAKPNYDWIVNFTELRKICEEVYGVPFDLQRGERGQGEYEIVTTGKTGAIQGYICGLGQGHDYKGKYIDGYAWVTFVEGRSEEDILEGNRLAIEKWQSQKPTKKPWGEEWDRPFEKVGENGEYTFYQPDLDVVMTDLANRGEIPEGTYMVTIEW